MNRFLKKMLVFVVCLYACFLLLLIGFSTVVKNKMAKRGRGVVIDKNLLLASTTSPKIILLGGSNVCYGINSKLLQDSLKMPVVDMAINADIGMLFYYNQVRPYINKGDIVIGIPEYGAYVGNKLYGDASVYELCVVQPSNLKYITAMQWLRFPRFAGDVLKEDYNTFVSDGNSVVGNGRKMYNALGDYEGHSNNKPSFKASFLSEPAFLETYRDWKVAAPFKKMLLSFDAHCKEVGATYLHSFPVFVRNGYNAAWGNEIRKELKGMNIMNNPEEYLFGADSLYDTENHIQYKYRDLRTMKIAGNIKAFVSNNK